MGNTKRTLPPKRTSSSSVSTNTKRTLPPKRTSSSSVSTNIKRTLPPKRTSSFSADSVAEAHSCRRKRAEGESCNPETKEEKLERLKKEAQELKNQVVNIWLVGQKDGVSLLQKSIDNHKDQHNGEMNYLREVFATHTAIEEMNKMNKDIEEMNKMNKDNSERTSVKEKIKEKINKVPPGPVEAWPLKINDIDATVRFIGTEEWKGKKGENKKYEISIEARKDRAGR